METNYWHRVARSRLSRRQGIAALGGLAASAAFLAACGGDDSDSGSPSTGTTGDNTGSASTGSSTTGATGAMSKVATPVDTSSSARPGGIYQTSRNADEPQIDPLTGRRAGEMFIRAYSRLIDQQYSVGIPTQPAFEGILADSWEISPDNLTMTVKLREDASGTRGRRPRTGRWMPRTSCSPGTSGCRSRPTAPS